MPSTFYVCSVVICISYKLIPFLQYIFYIFQRNTRRAYAKIW